MYSVEEAKEKTCPQSEMTKCVGDRCMAWRWLPELEWETNPKWEAWRLWLDHFPFFLRPFFHLFVVMGIFVEPREEILVEREVHLGYCGLAGEPEGE